MTQKQTNSGGHERLWMEELLAFSQHSHILQKWHPVSFLDKGTFSRIFKVINRETGETAALKFVPNPIDTADCCAENSPEEEFHRSRFETSKREAEIMNRFHGEQNIVQYLEKPEFLKRIFRNTRGTVVVQYAVLICMPLYHNHTEWLPQIVNSREKRLELGMDIAKALMLFEKKGVYHRDIKPGNILLDNEGYFCLGDVGEAKLESEFTTIGFHGTRPYMAPEVYNHEHERTKMRSDHRSDIYSLGIILYKLFNHQRFPFLSADGELTEEAHKSYRQYAKRNQLEENDAMLSAGEKARLLRYEGKKLPAPSEADEQLVRVILRACAYDVKNRYQTARELYLALKECYEGRNAVATRKRKKRSVRKKTKKTILIAGAGMLAGVFVLLTVWAAAPVTTEERVSVASPTVSAAVYTAVPTPEPTRAALTVPMASVTSIPTLTATPTIVPASVSQITHSPVLLSTPSVVVSDAEEKLILPAVKLTKWIYDYDQERSIDKYSRKQPIDMDYFSTTITGENDYAGWRQAGVTTFRSGPLRQNAAYSTVEVESEQLSLVWSFPFVSDSHTYNLASGAQPLIVKWPMELRRNMGIYSHMKDVEALKEVIAAGQDGKVYFLDLLTGSPTRAPIYLGLPMLGGLSIATNGVPILGVGASAREGYHIINLIDNCPELSINRLSGFTGAALFDKETGAMIVGGQNGALYTADLGTLKQSYDYPGNRIHLQESVQSYTAIPIGREFSTASIDGSVAMYRQYAYYGDQRGMLQCVDINTLEPVWTVDLLDNVDATPALDLEGDSGVALYIGNTLLNRTDATAICSIYRLNALSGEVDWQYTVPELTFQNASNQTGCYASPVIGQNNISDRVIFTVSYGETTPSRMIALEKKTGSLLWQTELGGQAISSPVAVYNEAGDAWLVQAEENGQIYLLDAFSGAIRYSLMLKSNLNNAELKISSSPAVYGNLLVITTSGENVSGVHCIRIR